MSGASGKALGLLPVAATLLLASCGCGARQELTIAGSTSVQPFVEMLGEKFAEANPGLRIVVQGGGSTAGIQSVREGAAVIGMVSRALKEEENDLRPIVIARDGIAVIVHRSNPVENLTKNQVRDIFSGKLTDWSRVGVEKGRIRPVTREEGSGTRGAFQELVMHKEQIAMDLIVQDSNGSMQEVVAHDPMGIGYMSLGLVTTAKTVSIDGVPATREQAKKGAYTLVRPFLLVVKAEPQGLAKQFIDYVLSAEGQKSLEEEGLLAAK